MVVWAYDFDLETGGISNKRILIDRRSSFGEPDGMVVEYVRLSLQPYTTLFLIYSVPMGTCGSPCLTPTVLWSSVQKLGT